MKIKLPKTNKGRLRAAGALFGAIIVIGGGAVYVVNNPPALGTESPTTGQVGSSSTIAATHFIASHALTATVGGTAATIASGGTTDSLGAASVAVTIPAKPHGAQALTISDGTHSVTSGTNFTVTQNASGLSPTTGAAGTTGVALSASGYIASHALSLTVGGTSATITSGGTTDINGSANVVFTIPAIGTGTSAVALSDGTNSFTSLTSFTVTSGGGGGAGGGADQFPNVLTEVSTANVWMAATGSDSGAGCTFHSTVVVAPTASTACHSWDKAATLAQAGGSGKIVGVLPGTYGVATSSENNANCGDVHCWGSDTYILNTGTNPVTFQCQTGAAADSVTMTDPSFLFFGANHITFLGSCFHFHVPALGLRGETPSPACGSTSGVPTSGPITLDGVHMDSFDITGSCQVSIVNSQIGPIIACYGPGQNGGVGECPTSGALSSVTSYWAGAGSNGPCGGTTGIQAEPFVHDNGSTHAQTTLFNNDIFYGMNSLDTDLNGPCGGALHQGGILVWGSDGMTIENTIFKNNTIYDLEYNASTDESNETIINNVFGPPVEANESSNSLTPPVLGTCQEGLGNAAGLGQSYTNVLYAYNTFTDCESVGSSGNSFSNVRFIGNLMGNSYTGGAGSCNTTSGITYTSNVVANGGTACQGGPTMSGNPFTNIGILDFSLGSTASPPSNIVSCASGDAHITTDIIDTSRPAHTNCAAGAYER